MRRLTFIVFALLSTLICCTEASAQEYPYSGRRGFVQASWAQNAEMNGHPRFGLMGSFGYQFIPHLYVGGATGCEVSLLGPDFQIPILSHIHSDFLKRKNSPFADFMMGADIYPWAKGSSGNFDLRLTVGMRFNLFSVWGGMNVAANSWGGMVLGYAGLSLDFGSRPLLEEEIPNRLTFDRHSRSYLMLDGVPLTYAQAEETLGDDWNAYYRNCLKPIKMGKALVITGCGIAAGAAICFTLTQWQSEIWDSHWGSMEYEKRERDLMAGGWALSSVATAVVTVGSIYIVKGKKRGKAMVREHVISDNGFNPEFNLGMKGNGVALRMDF